MSLQIYIDQNASEIIRFAAEELAKYLRRMGKWNCTPVTRPAGADILLCSGTAALPVSVDRLTGAKHDAAGIIPCGRQLYLVGNSDRGVLFAVYEYLSRSGIQWFAPEEEFVPRLSKWEIPEKPYFVEAALKYRGHLIDSANKSLNEKNIIPYIDWLGKNRANYVLFSVHLWKRFSAIALPEIQRRGIILELGHHGFDYFLPVEKYFKSHPEWFSLKNGERQSGWRDGLLFGGTQICVSNEEAVNTYIDAFLAYVRNNPYARIFGVVPNDGHSWCECPGCRDIEGFIAANPVFPRHRQAGNQYLHIVRKVAERMQKEFPDKLVAFWAYSGTIEPPENLNLPSNTILSAFAGVNRCYEHSLFDDKCDGHPAHLNKKHADTLERWRNIYSGDIIIYEYYAKYIWASLPKLIPAVISREVPLLAKKGYGGSITFAERANWWTYEVNLLLHLHSAWRGRVHWKKWFVSYTGARYGEIAPQMRKYLLEMIMALQGFGRPQWECPEKAVKNAIRHLRRAEKALAGAEAGGAHTGIVRAARINHTYTSMIMELYRQSYAAQHAFGKHGSDHAVQGLTDAAAAMDNVLKFARKHRNSGSILFSSFNTSIHDNRAARYRKLIEKIKSNPKSVSLDDFTEVINGGAW